MASSTSPRSVVSIVSSTLPRIEGPADAELISAVRGGDVSAYGELFERHVEAARRLARQLVSPADADDLVSNAFAKVLAVLQRGGGPDVAFRAYLLTAVRRLHVDQIRAGSKLQTTDDIAAFDPGEPFRDTAVEGFENAAAAKAFASLPERWQLVLWHTEVEGNKPADIAPLMGMSANSVAALAYRAREGLRQAFLTMHAGDLDEDDCRFTHQNLGAYVRNGVSRRDTAKIQDHLGECRKCMAVYLELTEVNSNLAGIIGPIVLGGAAAAYIAAGDVLAKGGLLVVLGRARDFVASQSAGAAVAGVAATVVIAGTAFLALRPESAAVLSTADAQPGVVATQGGAGAGPGAPVASAVGDPGDPGGPDGTDVGDPGAPPELPVPGAPPTSSAPSAAPTVDPSGDPSVDPTGDPTADPTGDPTSRPRRADPTSGPDGRPDVRPDGAHLRPDGEPHHGSDGLARPDDPRAGPDHRTDRPDHRTDRPDHRTDRPDHRTDGLARPDDPRAGPDHRTHRPDHRTDRPDHRTDRPHHRTDRPHHRTDRPHHRTDRPHHRTDRPHHASVGQGRLGDGVAVAGRR